MKYPSTKRLSNLKDPSPWLSWTDWHFSEKLDGTCVQIEIKRDLTNNEISVAIKSRSGTDQVPPNIKAVIQSALVPQDKLLELMQSLNKESITVFGEGFGRGIQGQVGVEYGEPKFRAFATLADGQWGNADAEQWFVGELGLEFVPEVKIPRSTFFSSLEYVIQGLKLRNFQSVFAPNKLVEGIIARPRQTLLWPDGSRVLFKLKSEEYYEGDPQYVMDLNFRRTKKDNRS